MQVYRACAKRFAVDALSGEGAKLAGGRWNSRGLPVVFTSENRSLATLEVFVHFDAEDVPNDYLMIAIDIPDTLRMTQHKAADLPKEWRTFPSEDRLQNIGDAWLKENQTAILSVPSVIIPEERTYALNPLHADFYRIKAHRPVPFVFDSRLFAHGNS